MKTSLSYMTLILFLTFFSGCKKDKVSSSSDIKIIGHGGSGFYSVFNSYPTNSQIAIEHGIFELQADGAEVDVQIDKDGVLWLYHDNFLETLTNCFLCINDNNTSDLENCTYTGFSFPGTKLYKAEDLIQSISQLEQKPIIMFDVQIYEGCWDRIELADAMIALIREYNAFQWIQIVSYSYDQIEYIETQEPKIFTLLESKNDPILTDDNQEGMMDGYLFKNDNIAAETIEELKGKGYSITLFNASGNQEIKEALAKKPNQLIADDIQLTRDILLNQ